MSARDYYAPKKSPWPRWIAMAVLSAVMIWAASQLINYGVQMQASRSLRDELAGELATEEPAVVLQADLHQPPADLPTETADPAAEIQVTEPEPAMQLRSTVSAVQKPSASREPEILMTYHALWEKNNDLVGWLNVRAIAQIDLPVVQRNQSYYLRRDFYGRSNMNGTAFLDAKCSIWPRSDNLIIYAHNMKSGEMFGLLHKLRQEAYYRRNPLTSFNTIYERHMYVPVAVVLCSIVDGDDFFNFYVPKFEDQAEFDAYISRARELSSVQPPYDVRYGDQLLTLVTCYDEAHEQRLLVILRQVRPDENAEELAALWQE